MSAPPNQVSVGVFCFNQSQWVTDCLHSVFSQDPRPDRVFVVDDGSSDDSVAAARRAVANLAGATPVEVLVDGTNRGLATRMNEVLAATDTPYVVWVAADDMLAPGGLSLLTHAATAHPDADVVFGDLDVMDQDGVLRGYSRPADTWQGEVARRYLSGGRPYWDLLRYNNFIPGGMTLIRASALWDAGGYDPNIRTEDFNMWLSLGRSSEFRYVGRPVGRYRVVTGSESRRERTGVLDHAALLRLRTENDPPARAMVARLVALRWALSVARTHGRAPVTLAELAAAAGVSVAHIVHALPAAVSAPVLGALRNRVSVRGRVRR